MNLISYGAFGQNCVASSLAASRDEYCLAMTLNGTQTDLGITSGSFTQRNTSLMAIADKNLVRERYARQKRYGIPSNRYNCIATEEKANLLGPLVLPCQQNREAARNRHYTHAMNVELIALIITVAVVLAALFLNLALMGAAVWINQKRPRQRTFDFIA